MNPDTRARVDSLLLECPPGYAADFYRQEEEEEREQQRIELEMEKAQNEKPALFEDRRHSVPLAGVARGLVHDATCAGFAAWASIAINSHGHTDHGKKMATVAMAEAMRSKDVVFLCHNDHANLLQTEASPLSDCMLGASGETMADVLGMGKLPLDRVLGHPYYTEIELPEAPGVKIELLPALHCPGDCITMLLDTNASRPTAHIFTGDFCAEPQLVADVRAVMERWTAAHPSLVPGNVSMDGTGCGRQFCSPRDCETFRIKRIVTAMKCEFF